MAATVKDGNCHTLSAAQDYIRARISIEDRGHSSPCWIWQRCVKNRYGWTRWNGDHFYTHRLSYLAFCGEIAPGDEIDHLCRVAACCSPRHLEAVSKTENLARQTADRIANPKTICKHGHDTGRVGRTAKGHCKTCANALNLKFKRKAQAALVDRGGKVNPSAAETRTDKGDTAHRDLGPSR